MFTSLSSTGRHRKAVMLAVLVHCLWRGSDPAPSPTGRTSTPQPLAPLPPPPPLPTASRSAVPPPTTDNGDTATSVSLFSAVVSSWGLNLPWFHIRTICFKRQQPVLFKNFQEILKKEFLCYKFNLQQTTSAFANIHIIRDLSHHHAHRILLMWVSVCLCSAVLHNKGGPSMPVMHPKRSPTSTGDRELREGRMPSRKASCSVMGSHSLPPSSPMVSSANNPNKSEIPDRRKDMTATTVSEPVVNTRRGQTLLWLVRYAAPTFSTNL